MNGPFWRRRFWEKSKRWTCHPILSCKIWQLPSMKSLIFCHCLESWILIKWNKLSSFTTLKEEFCIERLRSATLREDPTTKLNWKVTLLWFLAKYHKRNLTMDNYGSVNGPPNKFTFKTLARSLINLKSTSRMLKGSLSLISHPWSVK